MIGLTGLAIEYHRIRSLVWLELDVKITMTLSFLHSFRVGPFNDLFKRESFVREQFVRPRFSMSERCYCSAVNYVMKSPSGGAILQNRSIRGSDL